MDATGPTRPDRLGGRRLAPVVRERSARDSGRAKIVRELAIDNASLTTADPAPVPEPATLAVFGMMTVAIGYRARRKATATT